MPRLTLRLAAATAVAAVGFVTATPALALPCAKGERLTDRTEVGWVCTNIKTGSDRIVPFGT